MGLFFMSQSRFLNLSHDLLPSNLTNSVNTVTTMLIGQIAKPTNFKQTNKQTNNQHLRVTCMYVHITLVTHPQDPSIRGTQTLLALVGPTHSSRRSPMLVDAIHVRVDKTPVDEKELT